MGLSKVSPSFSIVALAVAIIAIILVGITMMQPLGQVQKIQKFTIIVGEGEIIQEAIEDKATGEIKLVSEEKGGEETLTGEYHRWEPNVLVVKKGDKVELTVKNPRKHAHSFVLPAFGVDTGRIPGKAEQPDEGKRTVTVTFTADKAGVFPFICGIPFDHKAGNCDPDHARITGYLIVLEG
ncbi:MAG: cupredoxin domain-containing protein [Nitrososphaerales archaeon]